MSKKILVVDDEVGFTRLLKMNLEKSGDYQVMVENNSRSAVQVATEFKPDVIVLDVVMPGMDGGDVSAALRRDAYLSQIPIIMLTALVSNDEVGSESVVQAGDKIMLGKPVDLDRLIRCIEEMTGATA